MKKLQQIAQFLPYYLKAKSIYGVHSPFLYELIKESLEDSRNFYAFDHIERIRERLLMDHTPIDIYDFGAGSAASKQKNVKQIAKSALTSPYFCRFLFKLTNYLKPQKVLELGTSLGISANYIAAAAPSAQIISLEGDPNIAAYAKSVLSKTSVEVRIGQFAKTLNKALEDLGKVDLAFIDGNHQKDPTIEYFESILPFIDADSILIFDDIHWSNEMQEAWEIIRKHPQVKASVDLFFMGIIFFRKEIKERVHLNIIEHKFKPFYTGVRG